MIIFDLFEDNNNNPQNLVEGVNDEWFTQGSFIAAKKSTGREAFRILKQPEVIKSLEGNLQGKAGDYVITGPNGEEYLNSPEKFLQLKTDNGDGTASPKAIPKQVKLADHDGVLNTSWGDLQYTAGNDYIIRHGTGDYGAVKKDIFPKTYDVIKEEDLDEINRRGFLGLMGAGLGAAALAGLPDVAQAGNLEFGGPEHKYYGRLKRAHKDLMDNPAYSKEAESPKYLGPGGSDGFNSRSMFMRTDEVEAITILLPLLKKYGVDIQTGAPDSIRASTNSVAKAASATPPVIKPSKVGRGVYSMNLPDGTEALMYVGRPEAKMTKSLKAMLNGKPVTVFLTVDGREGVIPPESMQEGISEAEGPGRVDPILYKALARMTKGGYDDAKIALAIEFGLLDMKHNYAIANNYIPKLIDLYDQKNGMAEGSLREFAPVGGDNDGDDGFSEETLKQLAAQWYNGDEDPEVERTLEVAGWEIGQVEDDDEPGVFVVLAGDINGNSYIQWTEDELRQDMAEARKKKKKKASKSLGRYFFPGYGYYGGGESGEGGGDGGGGESVNRGVAEGVGDKRTDPAPSKEFVSNKFYVKFTPTGIEFYRRGKLVHTKSGDYSNPTRGDYGIAKGITARLWEKEYQQGLAEVALNQKNPSDQEGKISAELRKLRAQYPDARSDLEAVAIGGMEAHDDARKHLARVDTIVSKLDRAADQLQSVNTDQDSELNNLDRENNDLEQKIKDLEQKLSKVSQPRSKAADMPAQAKQDKQAKQDTTAQDAAPVAQRKPTAEPAAPAQSKQEPADKGVGLGHVAAQLKDLPSTINIGKKSVPDQLPPNVSKVNFDPDFGTAIARQGNLREDSGVNPYQENDVNLGAYNLAQTGSAWESRVPSITLQFGPNKSLRMSRPQLFAIMAILSSMDVPQDQQQQAATERVQAFKKILSNRDRAIAWLQNPEVQNFVASYPVWQAQQTAKNKNQQQKDLLAPQEPVQQELFRESTRVGEKQRWTVVFSDGTKKNILSSDEYDIAGHFAKQGLTVKKLIPRGLVDTDRKGPETGTKRINRYGDPVNEVSPEYIERYKKEHGRRATAADQAGNYAKGHEHFKKINQLTKQQFQRGAKPEKVDEISNFMTQPTEPVSPEEQWKRRIRLLAKQYQTNASSLAALARENGPDSAEAVAYEYLRDPSKIRVPGTATPASAVNWDEVIRRLPMGLSGMALLQAAEEYLINNKGMLRSTVRSLLNNDENQRGLSAAYAKKNTTSESVTENNEVVEQAISRRIMVGRKDLLLKYGPRRVMEAVEQVADHVGAVDEIVSSDVSGWINQVEQALS